MVAVGDLVIVVQLEVVSLGIHRALEELAQEPVFLLLLRHERGDLVYDAEGLGALSLEYLGHDGGQGGTEGLALVRGVLQVLGRNSQYSTCSTLNYSTLAIVGTVSIVHAVQYSTL